MRSWGSTASVVAAIADDAAAEIERLEREAEQDRVNRHAARLEKPAIDGAPRLLLARRTAAELDVEQDWQDTLTEARDRDEWMAAVVAAGRTAIAAGDVVPWTAALIVEAVRHLPGSDGAVIAAPAAVLAAIDTEWRSTLEREAGRPLRFEPAAFAAGCIARTGDGRVSFDNRLEAREARVAVEWRAALARRYDAAVGLTAAMGMV